MNRACGDFFFSAEYQNILVPAMLGLERATDAGTTSDGTTTDDRTNNFHDKLRSASSAFRKGCDCWRPPGWYAGAERIFSASGRTGGAGERNQEDVVRAQKERLAYLVELLGWVDEFNGDSARSTESKADAAQRKLNAAKLQELREPDVALLSARGDQEPRDLLPAEMVLSLYRSVFEVLASPEGSEEHISSNGPGAAVFSNNSPRPGENPSTTSTGGGTNSGAKTNANQAEESTTTRAAQKVRNAFTLKRILSPHVEPGWVRWVRTSAMHYRLHFLREMCKRWTLALRIYLLVGWWIQSNLLDMNNAYKNATNMGEEHPGVQELKLKLHFVTTGVGKNFFLPLVQGTAAVVFILLVQAVSPWLDPVGEKIVRGLDTVSHSIKAAACAPRSLLKKIGGFLPSLFSSCRRRRCDETKKPSVLAHEIRRYELNGSHIDWHGILTRDNDKHSPAPGPLTFATEHGSWPAQQGWQPGHDHQFVALQYFGTGAAGSYAHYFYQNNISKSFFPKARYSMMLFSPLSFR